MKTYKKLCLIILGLPLLLNGQTVIRIPMGQNIEKSIVLPLSLLVEDVRFIALETSPDCFLDQDISKIELFNKEIFISDYKYIYRFSLNGKFLNRIGKRGRGPGEYSSKGFQSFLIDKQNSQLIIFDLVTQRMIAYDIEGKFVRGKSIDFMPGPMEWVNEESFAVYNLGFTYENEPWKDFYILDREAKTVNKNKFVKQPDKKYGIVIYPPIFYSYKGKTRYKNPYENIIFEIDESKQPRPVYYLDYGKYEKYSDADDVEIRVKNNLRTNRANPKSFEKIGLLGLSETDNYLFIFYGHQEQRKVGIYDKNRNTFYQLFEEESKLFGFKDDLYGGLPVFPENGIYDHVLYTHYDILNLKENLDGTSGVAPKLRTIIESGGESDNPVVVIGTLRN
jgi:6-bladed beta-propeller